MALARPPVVSQTEWDEALAATTAAEEAVAGEMHQLEAARKRMPMVRVERDDYRFEGPDGSRSLPELFDGRSQLTLYRFFFEGASTAGPMPNASAARPGPTASPSSASCMLATSPLPWRPRHPRRTSRRYAARSFWYRRHDEFDDPPPSVTGGWSDTT